MEEYSATKYTISKLIDKLSFAEHTAGTLQSENDRLRKELSEKEAEIERLERAVAGNLSTITYWKDAAEKAETLLGKEFAETVGSFGGPIAKGEDDVS